jgi:hypothetical protein
MSTQLYDNLKTKKSMLAELTILGVFIMGNINKKVKRCISQFFFNNHQAICVQNDKRFVQGQILV